MACVAEGVSESFGSGQTSQQLASFAGKAGGVTWIARARACGVMSSVGSKQQPAAKAGSRRSSRGSLLLQPILRHPSQSLATLVLLKPLHFLLGHTQAQGRFLQTFPLTNTRTLCAA